MGHWVNGSFMTRFAPTFYLIPVGYIYMWFPSKYPLLTYPFFPDFFKGEIPLLVHRWRLFGESPAPCNRSEATDFVKQVGWIMVEKQKHPQTTPFKCSEVWPFSHNCGGFNGCSASMSLTFSVRYEGSKSLSESTRVLCCSAGQERSRLCKGWKGTETCDSLAVSLVIFHLFFPNFDMAWWSPDCQSNIYLLHVITPWGLHDAACSNRLVQPGDHQWPWQPFNAGPGWRSHAELGAQKQRLQRHQGVAQGVEASIDPHRWQGRWTGSLCRTAGRWFPLEFPVSQSSNPLMLGKYELNGSYKP